MQDLVGAGLMTFAGEISDGSTQPCRHCHKETQRSKARVVVLLFWVSGEETIWKEPMTQETFSGMSQIRDNRATARHRSSFD